MEQFWKGSILTRGPAELSVLMSSQASTNKAPGEMLAGRYLADHERTAASSP